jgi:flagellar biosynthetic protein FlhB
MAEENGEKTEAPTPRRREEAREQGQVARSGDLTAAALLLGGLVLLNWFGGNLVAAMRQVVQLMLSHQSLAATHGPQITDGVLPSLIIVAKAVGPLMLGVVIIAVAINVAQVGWHPTPSRLAPNFDALNPINGIGRLFQGRSIVTLLMGLLKMALVGATIYSALHGRINQILTVEQLSFVQIFHLGADLLYSIGLRVGMLLLVLALLDYGYQRWQFEQGLKMTKQEVKDEMRNMDGDPKIKMRRRQIAMQMAQKKLKKDVPTADVVITNPTEYAIALKYDQSTMHAPRVIAKGQGLIAKRIRELAIEAGVPILERKPLARALYKLVQVGQEIPEEFYSAVAEILAYVYELTKKSRRLVPV